jgi:superfamily II DNA or RNA helicase
MTSQVAEPTFAPGSVVVVRDEEWLVTSVEDTADGPLVRVQGLGELVRDVTAAFYTRLDTVVPLDPAEAGVVADPSQQYRITRLWLESTFRKTAIPIAEPSLTVATRGLADPLTYQQSAVRRALDPASIRPRILLADAVGLGKTLEIGMILSELVRRGRGERILIVTPRHILEQMQQELWTRFALPFVRLDRIGIERVRQKLPATRNPFTYYKRVIISIDTLKRERYAASLRRQSWDIVVMDESHNLSNVSTMNNALARLLARTAQSLILASATPHNGRRDSFAELVRLLDPSAVTPNGDLAEDELKRLVIRRHRHSPEVASQVGTDWAERQEPHNVLVPATPAENEVAHELETVWLWPANGTSPYSGENASLFPWTLAKAFLSSPDALEESIDNRIDRLRKQHDAGKDDRAHVEMVALQRLRDLNTECGKHPGAKYQRLVEHLKNVGIGHHSSTRVVVFAERLATLRSLQKMLPKDLELSTDAVDLLHGGLPDDEQQRVVDDFKRAQAPVRVLVTGDVASEGVNLHTQCHELVHYDIPWSLIRIEQRNGRIDRYGQKHPPRITALLLDPDSDRFGGDMRILAKLVEKENEAHKALGDAASLMGSYSVEAEEEQIRQVLAGQKTLDDAVRTAEQVAASNDLTAMLARLNQIAAGPSAAPGKDEDQPYGTGLYADDVSYLEDALAAAFIDPSDSVAKGGVAWRRDKQFGTVELSPPPDLAQRLEVLPQTYLAERKVTERLVLATTPTRGKDRLAAAQRHDKTTWPDAHFLAPLHPVLDWAADRALASLDRNQALAVRGDVDAPTVLLLGTLTNRRGQVVAASWLTAEFPTSDPTFVTVQQHGAVRDALRALGLDRIRANPRPVSVDGLQDLIRPAVHAAGRTMRQVFQAAGEDVHQRIEAWDNRLDRWDQAADALPQLAGLRQRRLGVKQERELVATMTPDRQFVRALVVVVAEEGR